MTIRLLTRTLSLALAGALTALPVLAQTAAPAPAAPAPAAAPVPAAPATPAPAAHAARRQSMVERRIATLRTQLKITPAEAQAFDAFAQVMRDNAAHMDSMTEQRRQSAGTMTAVDAMKSYQTVAHQHADDMDKLEPAFATLYDALSPAQQKLADQSFRAFAGRGHTRT